MNKLQWFWVYIPYLDIPSQQAESASEAGYVKVVSKSEADKVIVHNKYKRCLAMAKICEDETEINRTSAYDASEYMPSREDYFRRKAEHYERWHKRWLELAEKFKEASK